MGGISARILTALILAWLACCFGPADARAATPVTLQVTAGYDNYYRLSPDWTPVRVSIHNAGTGTIDGSVLVRGASDSPPATTYTNQVVLAAGTTKQVAVYLPGSEIGGSVQVTYQSGDTVLASGTAYPNPFGATDFVVGALTSDAQAVTWLWRVKPRHTVVRPIMLSPSMLDSVPQALASFDAIVLSNVDTSALDADQTTALEWYVRNGGALILVGGSDWQETLSSLPRSLVPGHLAGSQTLPDLSGIASMETGRPPGHVVTVSSLHAPRGVVLSQQGAVPLVVRSGLGDGQIEYLAFDPADTPLRSWSAATPFLTRLVAGATPVSLRRVALSPADRASSVMNPVPLAYDMGAELRNLTAPALPVVLLLGGLLLGGLLIIFLIGRMLARLLGRRHLSWATFAVLVAVFAATYLRATPTLARQNALVNTVNVVRLEGAGPEYPASRYVGLFAPISGDYRLQYTGQTLARTELEYAESPDQVYSSSGPQATIEEGASGQMALPDVATWSTRVFNLQTTVSIPGGIDVHVHLDRSGNLVGTVVNRSGFPLLRSAVIAGEAYSRLGDIPAGGTAHVHVDPAADAQHHDEYETLFRLYGRSVPDFGAIGSGPGPLFGPPSGLPRERTLDDRIRNAVSALPETRLLPVLGEIMFIAWSDRPLGIMKVDGETPRRRDLSLLIKPVTVSLPHGLFALHTGSLGARALEVVPQRPQYDCCGTTIQPISLGSGGSAIFAFEMPAPGSIHFSHLRLDMYAGGSDPSSSDYHDVADGTTSVYDWRTDRWVEIRFRDGESALSHPDRLISPTGVLLVRLRPTNRSGDMTILDAHQNMQIAGDGEVR